MGNDDAGMASSAKKRRWRPLHYVRARPRTFIALLIFIVAGTLLMAMKLRPATAVLLAFDLAALVFLGIIARMFNRASPAHMRSQARAQDTGRWGILWSGIVLSTVVLVALSSELHAAKGGGMLALGVGALSVVLSWLFLNIMFAIHYAHGFYGDLGEKHAGLEFPDTPQPDYWDFAYFAIVIGMTFQVSDVQITSRYLRRVALLHSVIAFFFNVFIIAITVNIVAGQGG
jgi:Predicted membrane protein